jgi:hypothetical protein
MKDYVYVGDDWNPWNGITSDSGKCITIDEVISALLLEDGKTAPIGIYLD